MVRAAPVAVNARARPPLSEAMTFINWIWLEVSGVLAGTGEDTVAMMPFGINERLMS